ncbi:unnamed protein product [Effrenium voratum]|nr:unnamed protein product [Effrenium voratum]
MACWRGLCKACRSLIRPRTTALPARAVSSGTLRQRYTLETKLGAGAFGIVWRALRRADGLPFAVKMSRGWRRGEGSVEELSCPESDGLGSRWPLQMFVAQC